MSLSLITRSRALAPRLRQRWRELTAAGESGMSTAEYAVGTLAACTFAAVLIAVVKSGTVSAALTKLVTSALAIGS
ncbi:DUF4244 domain-containing protein [Mobilicoccus caccae]|uniref:DUF4244 domain-containing protein n=1 Tax=Mobilicoccus caccae TaxID=1859295 RepID=A0ABQ6INM7_9MICO|nr:DUF4244 domain-containing protein [Mobilicoccus caccae]GMA38313.1 hypothetical protein GCM10025883_03580 [Mobilicoccus caccae]